ncbi:hypothetical protein BC834DRAFT_880283 [Gloeopeniophorella convolvens]|nr:hypothetical protein BC834DRAFT_880283 [Gloeopeniophorella convolvens]
MGGWRIYDVFGVLFTPTSLLLCHEDCILGSSVCTRSSLLAPLLRLEHLLRGSLVTVKHPRHSHVFTFPGILV